MYNVVASRPLPEHLDFGNGDLFLISEDAHQSDFSHKHKMGSVALACKIAGSTYISLGSAILHCYSLDPLLRFQSVLDTL